MNELETFIKYYNLVFTDSVTEEQMYSKDFDLETAKVDFTNSISLYEMITIFNEKYKEFKKDFENAPKPSIAECAFCEYSKKAEEDVIKEYYLNVYKKYDYFLDAYNKMKNKILIGDDDEIFSLQSTITGESLNSLNKFYVKLGERYFNSYTYVTLECSLEKHVEVIEHRYRNSHLGSKTSDIIEDCLNKMDLNQLLHMIYVNRKKLPYMYRQ